MKSSCYLCQSDRLRVRYRVPERLLKPVEFFEIDQCLQCGFMQTHPLPAPEHLDRYYPPEYGAYADVQTSPFLFEPRSGTDRIKLFLKRELLRTHYGYLGGPRPGFLEGIWKGCLEPLRAIFQVPPPWREERKLLDIGCGSGRYLEFARNLGWEVAGVERDQKVAERVARRIGSTVRCDRFESTRFEDHSFTAVSLWHVLEHLYDPKAVLKEVRRILKPGGSLIIGVPNEGCVERRLFARAWWFWEVPRHFWHFNPRTLRRLLEDSGFEVDRFYAQPLLQPYNLIVGMLDALSDFFPSLRAHPWRRGDNYYRLGVLLLPLGYLLTWFGGASKMVVIARPKGASH